MSLELSASPNAPTPPEEWRQKYFEMLLSGEPVKAHEQKLEILKQSKFLYRFRSLSDFGLRELITGQTFMATPDQLNDPYECKILLNHKEKYTGGSAYSALTISGIKPEINLCSFCGKARNVLMWAHYAKHAKGCCLEFRTEDLLAIESIARGLHPVIYKPTLYDANQELTKHKEHLGAILTRSACHKLESWRYELEWRLISIALIASNEANQIIGANSSFWGDEYISRQSHLVGVRDGKHRFVELPKPCRIILYGDKIDPKQKNIIHGLTRLSDVPLALAQLTPDAEVGEELEIVDA